MKWPALSKTAVIISVIVAMLTIMVIPTFAEDGRIDPRPGDRIAVYCQTTTIDVYGVDDQSRGIFLAAFTYGDLFRLGAITFNTSNGQVTASVTPHGVFNARWLGGAFNATGVGDFTKRFECPSSFYTPPTFPSAPGGTFFPQTPLQPLLPSYPSFSTDGALTSFDDGQQSVVIQQTATNTGSGSINQSVIFEIGAGSVSTSLGCGVNTYTVRTGDNLFRIAQRYSTTVNQLAACNGIANPSRIFVGQVLHVP